MLVEFSLSLLYSKFFRFMEFTFLENGLIRGIFTHASPHSKLVPKVLPSRHRQKEITHSPRQHTKTTSEKISYLNEGWLFIGSFKAGTVKKCYPTLYINLNNQLKNCLSRKSWKDYYSIYIEGRRWVNAQILLTNCQYIENFGLVGIIYKHTKFGF